MRKLWLVTLVVAILALVAAPSLTQTPVENPTTVKFACSADHATVTNYTLGIFAGTVPLVYKSYDIGKPTPDAENTCTATINVSDLRKDTWYGRIRADESPTLVSDWSDISLSFRRAVGKPGAPVFSR